MGLKIGMLMRRIREIIFQPVIIHLEERNLLLKSQKVSQILLSMKYKELLVLDECLPKFDDIEFRAFSQNGEDGILLYIFSLIGTSNKKCIEICAGDGLQCNTANLIINHGWQGLLFDGSEEKVKRGQKFFERCLDTGWRPKQVQAWITTENINALIKENGFVGEIDLLSLDIDGNDFWIWKTIDCINPRVIVLEYNVILGPDISVTIPYKADFVAEIEEKGYMNYYGASLSAFVKLGKQKGYRLVGCERYGYNAFFVRDGIGEEVLPEISASTCFDHPVAKCAMEVRRPKILSKRWVEV